MMAIEPADDVLVANAAPRQDLAETLAAQLSASLDGAELTDTALRDAARFLLVSGSRRKPEEAAIVVESVTGPVAERATRIAAINADMPFLVDSIAATLAAQGVAIDRLVHPIIAARRDGDGELVALGDGGAAESWVYIEAERIDARHRVKLRGALAQALADVHAAVRDWRALQAALAADAAALAEGAGEVAALLRWLGEGKLTLLGHVLHHRDGGESDTLGICTDGGHRLLSATSYRHAIEWFDADSARPLLIVKANHVSRVHRRVPLDLLIVPRRARTADGAEAIVALSVHAGIWTSAALAAPPGDVPVLRRQLDAIMRESGYDPASHAGKALVHALTSLPHDLLIGFPRDQLARVATTMISLLDRPRAHLTLVRAPLERHLFAFVWLPRDALSSEVRERALAMIAEAANARLIDWTMEVDGALATIRAVLGLREGSSAIDRALIDEAELDAQLRAMVRGWPEAVEAALGDSEAPGRAAALAARFADAFPDGYRAAYGASEAAADIRRLNALGDGSEQARDARLHCFAGCAADDQLGGELRLKLYQRRGVLALSDAVPAMENFGFRVIGETPTLLGRPDTGLGAIHDFQLALPPGVTASSLLARADAVERAVGAVLNGAADDDAFNRLIVGVGMSAREANWLRALYRYMRQTGLNFGIGTVVDALVAAPMVARGLVELFVARHDPAFVGDRAAALARASDAIRDGLVEVAAINDDRLLRRYRGVVDAIVRTNAFQPIVPGAPEIALAFKFDSALVPLLPRPVPWREIFVHARRVEGIHLRAGPIARGGLRWSDRRDDFRTEVLGLMKAQRVKNAVIVPTGAKGGFFPKHLPDPARDREGWMAEGTESYRLFVRSLLSLTDNIAGETVVHPADTLILDGDDPYFVVAADKGTASFSDIANAIAAQRDFWLDDAFASGGSKGYDHKAMAITARGAWLSVRRHFLELGIDVQSESVRVVGCGDMSGDVFGNGMLLSHAIKLVAAFDHRHIFLDPDPDTMRSYDERKRLFGLPRSSWDDYNKAILSKGGGVFARTMKAIPLSPQVRELLGIAAESVDPETLIRAILTAPVDLLWFGGIGTYVKAAGEPNTAVGDPANDTLRIDGREVRARVIGEGANLGVTQAGRIEFALEGADGPGGDIGGRINTDFIDNSAGVDCSDNEVNIKIALASAKRAGRLSEDDRVALLARMTDEVAALVLEDNRLQALALSIAEAGGTEQLPAYLRLIDVLEQEGQIDRRGDGLADADTLSRRAIDDTRGGAGVGAGANGGTGLVRPELAVILSSSKLSLQAALEAAPMAANPLIGDPLLDEELLAAFPATMRDAYREDILGHRLRRELVATKLANRIVNRLGLIHPFELIEEEGVSAVRFAAAFVAAERLFDMRARWRAIESALMPEPARIMLFAYAASALRPHIADLLRIGAASGGPTLLIAGLEGGMHRLFDCAAQTLGAETRAQSQQIRDNLVAAGAPVEQAALVADLFDLDGAIGIAALAARTGVDAGELAGAFVDLGGLLGLDWAQGKAARMNPSDPWERLLVGGLARDFQQMRLRFLELLLAGAHRAGAGGDPRALVARWAEDDAAAIGRFRAVVQRAQGAVSASPAMLAQLASQAEALLGQGSQDVMSGASAPH